MKEQDETPELNGAAPVQREWNMEFGEQGFHLIPLLALSPLSLASEGPSHGMHPACTGADPAQGYRQDVVPTPVPPCPLDTALCPITPCPSLLVVQS